MKRKLRSLIMIIAVSAVVIVSGCPASAGTNSYSPYYYSEAGSTQITSYYTERKLTYQTSNGTATGNQIFADFANGPHYISYGVDGLYEYTDRGVVIRILEMDGTSSMDVKRFTPEFIIDAYGRYALDLPCTPSFSYPSSVENDGTLELKLAVFVDNYALDTSTTVPAQFFSYRFYVPG